MSAALSPALGVTVLLLDHGRSLVQEKSGNSFRKTSGEQKAVKRMVRSSGAKFTPSKPSMPNPPTYSAQFRSFHSRYPGDNSHRRHSESPFPVQAKRAVFVVAPAKCIAEFTAFDQTCKISLFMVSLSAGCGSQGVDIRSDGLRDILQEGRTQNSGC